MKNLEEIKNNDKMKEILDNKNHKKPDTTQNLIRILTSSTYGENTKKGLPNAIIKDAKHVI